MTALITPQLGLLEDDIVYRLSMLAINLLDPLKTQFPNLIILSGFRQTNTGVGQHELGEAVDLQMKGQTDDGLYQIAMYIRDYLNFDQLILNFTCIGDGKPWIHVSFSPTALRYDVLTKDYNDVFHQGLALVTPLTGEARAAVLRDQANTDTQIAASVAAYQARQARLNPAVVYTDDVMSTANTTAVANTSGMVARTHTALIDCVYQAILPYLAMNTPDNLQQSALEVVKRVAWQLRANDVCLVVTTRVNNTILWNGYNLSTCEVCLSNGQLFNILGDPSSGTFVPQWTDAGYVNPPSYIAPLDPGTDFNVDWQQCVLPTGGGGRGGGGQNSDRAGGRTQQD